jgi:hypothetical protein
MNNNIKTGVGLLVPAAAIIAFFFSIFTENYLLGVFLSVSGVLVWFVYAAVMETEMPNATGNIIILFGLLLSFAVFLNYGWERNMFGGVIFNLEGAAGSVVLLFFSVLLGVLFKNKPLFLSAPKTVSTSEKNKELNSKTGEPYEELNDPTSEEETEGYSQEDYADFYEDYYSDYPFNEDE